MERQQEGRLSRPGLHPGWTCSWLAALLAACILSSCIWSTAAKGNTSAKIVVVVDPSKPRVGENITLTPEGEPNFDNCHWYRGAKPDFAKQILTYYPSPDVQQQNGTAYTGREIAGPGCSLTIRNLTMNDAGTYTVKKLGRGATASEEGQVDIMVSDGPYVKLNPGGTIELKMDSYLKLECAAHSVPAPQLQWFFNNIELNVTGSIFIIQVKDQKDQGTYTCRATNPFTNHSASASAYVKLKKVSGSSVSSSLEAGSMAGIIIGSLAVLALNGTLLYFIFRSRGKTSGQIEAAPSSSDNFGPSRQVKAESIKAESTKAESTAENPVYQTLQHGDQATYEQLKIVPDKSTNLYTIT